MINCDLQKLELLGTDYLLDMIRQYLRDMKYQVYVTDSLRLLAMIGGRLGHAEITPQRFYDQLYPPPPEKEKTAEEIIEETCAKAGITIVGGEEDEHECI